MRCLMVTDASVQWLLILPLAVLVFLVVRHFLAKYWFEFGAVWIDGKHRKIQVTYWRYYKWRDNEGNDISARVRETKTLFTL